MANLDLDNWRDTIEQVLTEYTAIPYSYSEVRKETVFDRVRDLYLILVLGIVLGFKPPEVRPMTGYAVA